MSKVMRRLRRNAGAALVEYALIIAGVALIGAAAVSIFGNKVTDMLATAAAILPGAHADSNAPIVSGKIIETSPNAAGFDEAVGVVDAEHAAAGVGRVGVSDAELRHRGLAQDADVVDGRGCVAGARVEA